MRSILVGERAHWFVVSSLFSLCGNASQMALATTRALLLMVRLSPPSKKLLTVQSAHPIWANADDADGNLQLTLEKVEVSKQIGGELSGVGDDSEVGVPAGEGDVLGGDGGEFAGVRELGRAFAGGGAVVGAGLDFSKGIENIGLHEVKLGDAVEHDGVAKSRQVYPAGATRTAGGGTKLAAGLADLLTYFVLELGGERATTDAGAIGLGDAIYLINVTRGNAKAGAGTSGDGTGRGNKGIGTEVNIQQRALGTFGKNALALSEEVIEKVFGVGELKSTQEGNGRKEVGFESFDFQLFVVVGGDGGVLGNGFPVALLEIGEQDVPHAKADTTDFIGIGGADAFEGATDFGVAASFLANAVEGTVRGQDKLGLLRNVKVFGPINSPIG